MLDERKSMKNHGRVGEFSINRTARETKLFCLTYSLPFAFVRGSFKILDSMI